MASTAGIFTISLDFELHWGVHDQRPLAAYARNLLGAREAIPRMLELFDAIALTWATVGLLFCAFALSADRPDRAERAAGPLSLWSLVDRADPGLPRPGDRHPHLLALLLPGAGRDRGRPVRGDVPSRSAGGAPRGGAARHHPAQPGVSPATSIAPTTSRPVAPRASRWCAATIRPGGSALKVAATRACSSAPAG